MPQKLGSNSICFPLFYLAFDCQSENCLSRSFGYYIDYMEEYFEQARALLPIDLLRVAQSIEQAGGTVYLVGGWVRDFFLEKALNDYDLEVYGLDQETLTRLLKPLGRVSSVGKSFGILTLLVNDIHYDFAFPRTENKTGQGHKGFMVKPDPHLDFTTASARRDFTINSMGLRLPDMLLFDPHGGRGDLSQRILRHVSNAFSEDPLRALRAVQFAARFECNIHPATQELCRQQALAELSPERLFAEFKKLLLKAKRPSLGLEWMRKLGQLRFFPELLDMVAVPQDPQWHPEGDVWTHNCMVVDAAAQILAEESDTLTSDLDRCAHMFGALCHDLGKPSTTQYRDGRWRSHAHDSLGDSVTRRFLGRLTNDLQLTETVCAFVREHLKPAMLYNRKEEIKAGAIRRLALKVDINKLVLVAKADHFGRTSSDALEKDFPAGDWLLEQSQTFDVLVNKPQPWLTGKSLLALGMQAGPEIGQLIKKSFELQLDGAFSTPSDTLEWAKKELSLKKSE